MADYRDYDAEEKERKRAAEAIAERVTKLTKKLCQKGGFTKKQAMAIAEAIIHQG